MTLWRAGVGVLFALLMSPLLKADTLKLTSLLWPPYAGQQLECQGVSIMVAKAALNAMGHDLQVDFYPWSRAVKLASKPNTDYLGYFPEYHHQTDVFIFSKGIGSSPLGLVEQKLHPISWTKTTDLKQYVVGVVQGYVNTDEIDSLIASGGLRVEAVSSDEHNIKKVAAGRIDAAVIDVHVLRYLLQQKALAPLSPKLQMNKKLLESKQLHVAFLNNAEGKKWRDIMDQGLAKIDVEDILERALSGKAL